MSAEERPPERSLAEAAAERVEERRGRASALSIALSELGTVDRAVYEAIARTATPSLDVPLRRLSNAANGSRLWLARAAPPAGFGGGGGGRAAPAGGPPRGGPSGRRQPLAGSGGARQDAPRGGPGPP